jgi:uncharacterized RDD family membrane protein YckC
MNYAGFWKRATASFIDGLILFIPSLVFSGGSTFASGVNPFFGISASIILGFLYKPFFESSEMSATPGKALMNLVVLQENGDVISFKQASIRFFCTYLSSALAMIGYIIQPFTSKRQCLHDIIAETIVIERKAEDLNYFSVWKNQFKMIINKL